MFAGKFVNHKGRNRHFTNPEELEEQRRQEEEKRKWRVRLKFITIFCSFTDLQIYLEFLNKHTSAYDILKKLHQQIGFY